jgi:hypothetical protein
MIRDIYAAFRPHNTPIRSLDIRPGEKWTLGLLPWHMAQATLSNTALPKEPKRRSKLWRYVALAYLAPSLAALSLITMLWLLRHGT